MNDLSVIYNATAVANNVTTMLTTLEPRYDTRTLRKAGNKLVYSLQTIGNARQIIKMLGCEGRDLQRTETLVDAFTISARDDIMKTLR